VPFGGENDLMMLSALQRQIDVYPTIADIFNNVNLFSFWHESSNPSSCHIVDMPAEPRSMAVSAWFKAIFRIAKCRNPAMVTSMA
jgi:hypothetical protein